MTIKINWKKIQFENSTEKKNLLEDSKTEVFRQN